MIKGSGVFGKPFFWQNMNYFMSSEAFMQPCPLAFQLHCWAHPLLWLSLVLRMPRPC